ncbi:MAG TPA: class I SAM-dependent methyltransferase [Candidatus Aquilonibacter sp.]|nr:class I SAM-dependent methyltransferase [Candidatus Aquilonibacter sp.]
MIKPEIVEFTEIGNHVTSGEIPLDREAASMKPYTCEYSIESSRYAPQNAKLDKYSRNRILLEWVGTGKRVLEVGCSTGYMSQLMKQRNCTVTGIEVDAEAARCAANHCEEVHVLDLNSPEWIRRFTEGRFEVVLLGDVLEHLVDPARVLSQMRELLAPNGSLVISLPNIVHWEIRAEVLLGRFDYQSCGILDHTHLRFFTLKSARELIESAGCRIVRFHPAVGGRRTGHARPLWQMLARMLPGLFAYQFLFQAKGR